MERRRSEQEVMNGMMSGGTETMMLGGGMGSRLDLMTVPLALGVQTAGNLERIGMNVRVGNRRTMSRTRDHILVHLNGERTVPRHLLATTNGDHSHAHALLVLRLHHARL